MPVAIYLENSQVLTDSCRGNNGRNSSVRVGVAQVDIHIIIVRQNGQK